MNGARMRTIREENGLTTLLFGQMLIPTASHEQVNRWEYEQDRIPLDVERQSLSIDAKFQRVVAERVASLRRLGARAMIWRYRTHGDFRADQKPAEEIENALLAVHSAVVRRVYRRLSDDGLELPIIYLAVHDYWRWCSRLRYPRSDETRDLWAAERGHPQPRAAFPRP
jgi:hypothetical protein